MVSSGFPPATASDIDLATLAGEVDKAVRSDATRASDTADIAEILALGNVSSVFQPIVDLQSGTIVGYEALARGPRGPLHNPFRLFAAAQAAGRLAELDALCLTSALRGAIAQGISSPLTLFVNIEPEAVGVAGLKSLIAMAEAAPDPLSLVLEITERALATRPAELLATVRCLRDAGWRIALDDVGADDMSLAFMPLLQPDIIKLDLQLVQRRPSPVVAEIMHAVNAHAERTGCVLLAEGIETQAHLEAARALGAQLGQGWLFGRPVADVGQADSGRGIMLPAPPAPDAHTTPFTCLPAGTALRRSQKSLLIEFSKHLELQAAALGATCLLLSTFQEVRHYTAQTQVRYRDLGRRVGFVAAMADGLLPATTPGVRGADLAPDDPLCSEWDIVVLAPHFAAALIARDLRSSTGPAGTTGGVDLAGGAHLAGGADLAGSAGGVDLAGSAGGVDLAGSAGGVDLAGSAGGVDLAGSAGGADLAGSAGGADRDRLFEFALTYDRDCVIAAARTLMSRIVPDTETTRYLR